VIKVEKGTVSNFDVDEAMPGGTLFDVNAVGTKVQVVGDYGVKVQFVLEHPGNVNERTNIVVETPTLTQIGKGFGMHKPSFVGSVNANDEPSVARFRRIHSHLQGDYFYLACSILQRVINVC